MTTLLPIADHPDAGLDDRMRGARGELATIVRGRGERARTQRNALTAFSVRVASAGILYLSQVALARWMGSFEYGIYVYVWTWVLLLAGLSHLGLNTAMIRLLPEYLDSRRIELLRGLLFGGRWLVLILSTGLTLAGLGALAMLSTEIAPVYALPIALALFCVPAFTLTDVQDGIGRGGAWMGIALGPPYVLRPLLVLAAIAGAHAAGLPLVASTAAAAAVVATWTAYLVQTMLVERQLRRVVPMGPRRYAYGAWLGTSLPLLVIGGCELLLQNTDVLVISHYMTPTDAGIYFASAKTMSLILFVHYAVGSAVANRFAALSARGDHVALQACVRDAVRWTFWPSLAVGLAILALGQPLLLLFGPQFGDGYAVMFVLIAGFLARAAVGPVEFLLNMSGQQKLCAKLLLLAAALNIVLNLALVPHFGILGAAAATSAALSAAACMNYIAARRRLGLDIAIWADLPARRRASQ